MEKYELVIGIEEGRRINKYGIYAGKACLKRFKSSDAASEYLEENRSILEYWAGSASVSIQNCTEFKVIDLRDKI